MLNNLIIDLFDYEGKELTREEQAIVKSKLAPYCVYVENNFLSLFNTTSIDRKIIESEQFKNYFIYLSSHYSVEEILHLIDVFHNCRNTMCHYMVMARENESDYVISNDALLSDLSFFDDTVCSKNGSLTLQGMISLIILFLNNEQTHNFIDLLSNIPELHTGKYFFKSNKELEIKAQENAVLIRNQLKKRFKNMNCFSFPSYHDYIFLATKTAPLFLSLEEFCYKHWNVTLSSHHSTYSEPLFYASKISAKTKNKLKRARNFWAHGNLVSINKGSSEFLSFVIDALGSLKDELLLSRDKEALRFLQEEINKLADSLFVYKYKRLVELAIKISLPESYEPEKRIKNISHYNFNYNLISPHYERRLWGLSNKLPVHFNFKNTIKECPARDVSHIDVYKFTIPKHMYALVNGVKVIGDDQLSFHVVGLKGMPTPKVEIFDDVGTRYSWKMQDTLNNGFIHMHYCKYIKRR